MEELKLDMGSRIREVRRRAGLKSQEDLAELLGLKKGAVSKWERNESCPSAEMMLRLSIIGNVSLDWLVGGSDEREDPGSELTDRERRLLRLFRALPLERQNRLLEVAVDEHLAYMEEKNI